MKIAVYTICKNEEQFIDRWLDSCIEADYILIVDTGSTDGTLAKLDSLMSYRTMYRNLHVNEVCINPWRFDDARQFSLSLLPKDIDICICLDMDEILTEGWREIIEDKWEEGADRLRYDYIWSWNVDGTPAVTYHADKIHARHGFRWTHPVHEVLVKDSRLGAEKQVFIGNTLIEHYPDVTKSRSSYLPLLELSCRENPLDDRNAHYYARELFFDGQYDKAIEEFDRHLALPTAQWKSERAASYRYKGDCLWALGKQLEAMASFQLAAWEAPNEREAYVAMAQGHRYFKNWEGVREMCSNALTIKEKPNTYINQPWAWSNWPQEMLEEAERELKTA